MKLPLVLTLTVLSYGASVSFAQTAWTANDIEGEHPQGNLSQTSLHPTSAILPAVQSTAQEFRGLFRNALKAHATKEMEKLVRARKDDAVLTVMNVCVQISDKPSDALEEEIQGLRKAWKAVYGTPFVNRQYEYFSLLKPGFKRTRTELLDAYGKTFPIFDKARSAKDGPVLAQCADQLRSQAEGFEKIGDTYMASQAWYFAAQSIDEQYRGEDADLFRACAAWTKSAENRDRAGLKDHLYQWAKDRSEVLLKAGFDDPGKAAENAEAAAEAARAAAVKLVPSFEVAAKISAVQRPLYSADDIYQMWKVIGLMAAGSTRKIQTMPDSPTFIRDGAVEVSIDVDGDGEGDVPVPTTGNITPVRFTIGQGESQREVAILATIGKQDDVYQGFRQNLGPDKNQLGIYFAPAGSMVTELAGVPVRIYDDNLDGIYGSLGEQVKTWQYIGCRPGSYQPDLDAILIGGGKKALPFSEMIQVGEEWYRLQVEDNGKRLLASPAPGTKTGTLKLKLKGLKADSVVLRGVGALENVFIDVTANGSKGVEAPVGTYALFVGRVSKGKRQQTMKALILPGGGMDNFVVREGEVTTLDFGAPFGFAFDYEQDHDSVTVDGLTVVVSGKSGETYQRLWNCVPIVDVLARKAGSKKGTEIGGMRPTQSAEEVTDRGGYETAWFPIEDALEKGKLKGHPVEVRLYQKKNKLFGKIESDWKE